MSEIFLKRSNEPLKLPIKILYEILGTEITIHDAYNNLHEEYLQNPKKGFKYAVNYIIWCHYSNLIYDHEHIHLIHSYA